MYKSRLFVRGYGFLGQMGIKNEYYFKDWTALEIFDDVPIRKIVCNLGQTFISNEKNELYYFGWLFESSSIVKTYKNLNPPDIIKYFLLKNPIFGKYFFLNNQKLPIKLNLPFETRIKDIQCGNGVIYVLDTEGNVYGLGDNERSQLGQPFEDNNSFVQIVGDGSIRKISSGLQHLLMLNKDGNLLGCGASNYCQLPTRDKNIKEIKNVTKFYETLNYVSMSSGFFHSIFLEQNRKKVFAIGQNFKMQCAVSLENADILENMQEIFDVNDFSSDKDEIILDIKCGSAHNLYLTNKRLIFSGNNQKNQFPFELGNKFEFSGIHAEEIKFDNYEELKFENIIDIETNFDRTSISFKNGKSLLFGGINIQKDKNEDIKQLEVINEIEGLKIKKLIPGLQWEFAYCEN